MEPKHERDAAAVRVFPPAIPLVTVLAGLGLNRLWPIDLGFQLPAPQRYWVGGLIVTGAVLGLGWRSVVQLRRTGQSENPWKPTTQIVERSPFRITRNPMYLQMACLHWHRDSAGELVDSKSDSCLRLAAAEARDPARGTLS